MMYDKQEQPQPVAQCSFFCNKIQNKNKRLNVYNRISMSYCVKQTLFTENQIFICDE